jgi:RHS repeat-associated protein
VGFTGHEDDTELGLVNMGGRLYDPKLARFLQPDALVQAPGFSPSWNPYGYVWHSPLRYTDPSGWQVEPGQAGQGPPVVSDPYYRDENGAPYVCATPGCNLVTTPAEPLWTNGEDTTGPGPYGAQPQAAPAASPSQPAWSMSDAQFYSIVTPGNHLDYDSHGVAIPPDPTATLLELGVLAAPFLVELAPVLAAAAPELFGALSELGAGLLEGVAPGSAPAYAGAGAGVVAAGERGAGAFGRAGEFFRSFAKRSGEGIPRPDRFTVRRYMSRDELRQLKKDGIRFDRARGNGIPTTTRNFTPRSQAEARGRTGAPAAEYQVDLDVTGVRRGPTTSTRSGLPEYPIQGNLSPDMIIGVQKVPK